MSIKAFNDLIFRLYDLLADFSLCHSDTVSDVRVTQLCLNTLWKMFLQEFGIYLTEFINYYYIIIESHLSKSCHIRQCE